MQDTSINGEPLKLYLLLNYSKEFLILNLMTLSIVITIKIEICGVSKMGNPQVKNLRLKVE